MYHNFYELKYDPFTSTPDAASLFVSSSHQAVLQAITNGIKERRGLMAVVGEVGVGKTTLLRHSLERLSKLRMLFIPYAHLSFRSILQIMCREFGCDAESDDPVDMMSCLREILLKEYNQGWNVLLLLDEAQNLPVQTLAHLLLLANLDTPTGKLVQIVLIGQPAFEQRLKLPALRSFQAQLAMCLTISPLTTQESIAYLQHRLAQSTLHGRPVFTASAVQSIANAAQGSFRVLHTLCINALITGAVYQHKPIASKIALEVIADYRGKRRPPLWRRGAICAAALFLVVGLAWSLQDGYLLFFRSGRPELTHLARRIISTFDGDNAEQDLVTTSTVAQYQVASLPPSPMAEQEMSVVPSTLPAVELPAPEPLGPPTPAPVQPEVHAALVVPEQENMTPTTAEPVTPHESASVAHSPVSSGVEQNALPQVASPPTQRMASTPPAAVRQPKPALSSTPATSELQASGTTQMPTPVQSEVPAAVVVPKPKAAAPVTAALVAPSKPVRAAQRPSASAIRAPELPDKAREFVGETPRTGKELTPVEARPAAVPPSVLSPEPPPMLSAEPALLDGSSRLVIEAGGHTAMIRELLFTVDGRSLVSVSDDKTIRVWAVTPDGRQASLARTIRGQLGDGRAGMLAAAALSPPNAAGRQQWLAVGGQLAGAAPDCYAIRLHDYASGEVVALLPGHTDAVLALAFAPTGRWLASAGKDGIVRLWDLETLQGTRLATAPLVLTEHTDQIYDLAWSATGDRLAAASYDRTVGLWDTARLGQGTVPLLARLRGHTHQVHTVAFHPDGMVLASGGKDRTIRLWRVQDGAAMGVMAQATHAVSALAFAPDGRSLLAGNGSPPKPDRLTVFAYPGGKSQHVFTGHQNVVLATAFHPSGQWVASGGGEQKEILLWHTATGEVLSRLEGRGRTIYAVGFSHDGQYLSWGYTSDYTSANQRGPLEHRFDLTQLVRVPGGLPEAVAVRSQERQGELWLSSEHGGASDYPYRLHVQHGQRRLSTVERGPADGYRHSAYTLTPDGQGVVSGGLNGVLRLYALDGTLRATFVGHTGEIKAVAVSADGQWAVSGASDQTLRLWSLAALPRSGSQELAPVLTLFPAIDGEWVAWTPQGFFTASASGGHLLGYSLNQGLDKTAQYVPVEQMRARLYRPELILARLHNDLSRQPYSAAR